MPPVSKAIELNAYLREPLEVLADLDGFYERPGATENESAGPVVGYAGKYRENPDHPSSRELQWVGEIYANFAEAEQWPDIYDAWFLRIKPSLEELSIDTYMGMPMAGVPVAQSMARLMNSRFIYPDRKVLEVATSAGREKSKLVFGRHGIRESGERIAICEDVVNNLSTAAEATELVHEAGGLVVAIACVLNRSFPQVREYIHRGQTIPVIALVQKPIPQYKQDHPLVAADVATGNVVWKAKPEWPRLKQAMERGKK